MSKKALFLGLSVLAGAVFFWLAFEKVGFDMILETLSGLTLWQLGVVLALTLLIAVLWVWRWRLVLSHYGEKVGWKTLIQARLSGYSMSMLTPAMGLGGEPAQYILVRDRCPKVNKSNLIASIAIDKVFFATVNFLVTLLGIVLFLSAFEISSQLRYVIIIVLLLLFLLGLAFFVRAFRGQGFLSPILSLFGVKKGNGLLKQVDGAESAIHKFFSFKNPHLWGLFGLSLARAGVHLFRFYLIVLFLGSPVLFREIVVIVGVILLIGLLPIPSGLGSFELSQAFVFGAMGLSASLGVAMILIARIFDWGLALVGLLILLSKSMKHLWSFLREPR